jgi:hypothetical protein
MQEIVSHSVSREVVVAAACKPAVRLLNTPSSGNGVDSHLSQIPARELETRAFPIRARLSTLTMYRGSIPVSKLCAIRNGSAAHSRSAVSLNGKRAARIKLADRCRHQHWFGTPLSEDSAKIPREASCAMLKSGLLSALATSRFFTRAPTTAAGEKCLSQVASAMARHYSHRTKLHQGV